MNKEEMQRFLNQEAERGTSELEAYRLLISVLGIHFPGKKDSEKES